MRLFALLLLAPLSACSPGLGDRCNPLQFHNECGGGYTCQVPEGCAVAYCCPSPDETGAVTDPNCAACLADAGQDLASFDSAASD